MDWKVFKIENTRISKTARAFVSISKTGQFNFNKSACDLVNDKGTYKYAQFLEAEVDGKTILGIRFSLEESEDSVKVRRFHHHGEPIHSMSVSCASFYNKHFKLTESEEKRPRYDVEKADDNTLIIKK